MVSCQHYFKKQLNWSMIPLEHYHPCHFYISCWQKTSSCFPLLLFRSFLFLSSLAIVISHTAVRGNINLRFIYLTHWGLLAVLLTTAFSFAISARCHFYSPIGSYIAILVIIFNTDVNGFVKSLYILQIRSMGCRGM